MGVIDDPFRLGVILYILKDYMVGEKFQFSLHFESGALFEIWCKNVSPSSPSLSSVSWWPLAWMVVYDNSGSPRHALKLRKALMLSFT